jgi:hypothetical protein
MLNHVVKKLQIIITRHTKEVADATACQPVQQIISNGILGLHDSYPSDGNLNVEYRRTVMTVQGSYGEGGGKQDVQF